METPQHLSASHLARRLKVRDPANLVATPQVHDEAPGHAATGEPIQMDPEAPYSGSSQLDSFIAGLDGNKALENILMAIGFLAVLIAIGAYIQPLPGGSNPFWATCFYPLFTVYVLLNSLAIASSSAAAVAVGLGPLVMVLGKRENWRRQVVKLGIAHVAFSLVTLLAAYLCAVYIRAGLYAPDPMCARLRCTQGGVPCSPYSTRYSPGLDAGTRANQSSNMSALTKLANQEFLLDSTLVSLNRQHFVDGMSPQHWADVVICHDYGFLASNTRANEPNLGAPFANTTNGDVSRTCFVLLLGLSAFESSFVKDGRAFRSWPDTRTLWCSSNRSSIGPGWLSLPLSTAVALLQNDQSDSMYSEGCPSFNDTVLEIPHSVYTHLTALDLLESGWYPPNISAWPVQVYGPAFAHYLGILGGLRALQLLCDGNGQSQGQLCDTSFSMSRGPITGTPDNIPLRGAIPYEALRYRCSNFSNFTGPGVLCDHSLDPPLAVDSAGKYLSNSGDPGQDGVIFLHAQAVNWSVNAVQYVTLSILLLNGLSIAFLLYRGFLVRIFTTALSSFVHKVRTLRGVQSRTAGEA